jgi:hypothetical protein
MPAITLHKWFLNSPGARLERAEGRTYFLPDITDMVTDSVAVPVGGDLEIQLLTHSPQAIEVYERWDAQSSQLRAWSTPVINVYSNNINYEIIADMRNEEVNEEPDFSLSL